MTAQPAPAPRPIGLQALLTLLREGELTLHGLFPNGSNYTFFASASDGAQTAFGVYKPTKGEQPLWDFPENTLAFREVAAFITSEALGWGLVPPTVYRPAGPHGPGSMQFYIHAQEDVHYFSLRGNPQHVDTLQKVAVFDLLINNADRKGGHMLMDTEGKLWLIDHGICFHAQNKLRTVIWDFANQPIPEPLLADLRHFRARLDDDDDLKLAFNSLLDVPEVSALRRRANKLIQTAAFPEPGPGRNYPWPPM